MGKGKKAASQGNANTQAYIQVCQKAATAQLTELVGCMTALLQHGVAAGGACSASADAASQRPVRLIIRQLEKILLKFILGANGRRNIPW